MRGLHTFGRQRRQQGCAWFCRAVLRDQVGLRGCTARPENKELVVVDTGQFEHTKATQEPETNRCEDIKGLAAPYVEPHAESQAGPTKSMDRRA